jgi:hypothetical protein
VEPGPVEEPVQDLLVLPAQGPAELLPVFVFPLQHLAEGQYRPSHKLLQAKFHRKDAKKEFFPAVAGGENSFALFAP